MSELRAQRRGHDQGPHCAQLARNRQTVHLTNASAPANHIAANQRKGVVPATLYRVRWRGRSRCATLRLSMTITATDTFSFDIPDGWQTFTEGSRLIAQGSEGEELILSSFAVRASATAAPAELDNVMEELIVNAKAAAEKAASHPDLVITKPLDRDVDAGGAFPCWTLHSESRAQDVFFAQAVIRGARAVMLLTFEAPYSARRASQFAAFLSTLRSSQS